MPKASLEDLCYNAMYVHSLSLERKTGTDASARAVSREFTKFWARIANITHLMICRRERSILINSALEKPESPQQV